LQYQWKGHTDPKVIRVVDYSKTNAEASIFIGFWRLADPAKTTTTTEPAGGMCDVAHIHFSNF
jgi:hypothetical protein